MQTVHDKQTHRRGLRRKRRAEGGKDRWPGEASLGQVGMFQEAVGNHPTARLYH